MEDKFYNLVLRFLSYRPRSEKEIRDYFKIKNQKSKIKIEESIIDKIIEKLKKYNFINDAEFARKWVESRIRFKPRSWRLIKLELKQKGISQEIIEKMINPARNASQSDAGGDKGLMINDLESAKKLIQKKFEKFKSLPQQEIYQKLGRHLASKGFGWDTIKKSIDGILGKGV